MRHGLFPPVSAMAVIGRCLSHPDSLAELTTLGEPDLLACFFRLKLHTLLRQGPTDEGLSPAALIQGAERAALAGFLPLDTAGGLRRQLDEIVEAWDRLGVWRRAEPPWWAPLPEPVPELLSWTEPGVRLPEPQSLVGALAPKGCGFWVQPDCLDPTWLGLLATELTAAWNAGRLPMERAGVGRDERLSGVRNDHVCYLKGLEPYLDMHLKALIQYLLRRLPELFASILPTPCFAPGRVMLARYEGPAEGYRTHVDNPGGDNDNGRCLSFTLYLNDPEKPCRGGELAIWARGGKAEPARVVPATGGSAVMFDPVGVPHQVLPTHAGPPRWALVIWLNRTPRETPLPLPTMAAESLLLPLADPPLEQDRVVFHRLSDTRNEGEITVHVRGASPRVGIVATVYRAEAYLEHWCAHHFAAGIDHAILIFDHLGEPEESALAHRLVQRFGDALTIWDGTALAAKDYQGLPQDSRLVKPRRIAGLGGSSHGVSARQMLGASLALSEAKRGHWGLDWLLHLDADELLYPQGAGRGGASLNDCFSAASEAGLGLLRFVNHERLVGPKPRFKLNPRLARARLGSHGWAEFVRLLGLDQEGPRPWFTGYHNGKSAVLVSAGRLAAGVHGWYLDGPGDPGTSAFLAGPHVLHFHLQDAAAFKRKYLRIAASPVAEADQLFRPSPLEETALSAIAEARRDGLSRAALARRLEALYMRLTRFTAREQALLEEAGLFFHPRLTVSL